MKHLVATKSPKPRSHDLRSATGGLFAWIRRLRRASGGTVTLAFAISSVFLVAGIGSAIDFNRLVGARGKLQSALDVAVIGGATNKTSNWNSAAQALFSSQFEKGVPSGVAVNFTKGSDNIVVGTATHTVPMTFMSLFGVENRVVGAKAKAKTKSGPPVCILLTGNVSQALLVNSGAYVTAPECEIHVKSTSSNAGVFNAGSSVSTHKICIKSNSILKNGGTYPNLETSCDAIDDPYAGKLPTPSSGTCTYSNGNYNGGTVNLNPGVYCGWFNFNGAPTVNFAPGVYVIKNGGFNVNGGVWNGTGVTFYYADTSKIQFNSGVKAILSAPTSGTYSGILMYEASNLSQSQFIFDDSQGHKLEGLIWLPSRDTTFNSGSDTQSDSLTMVLRTLILNTMNWKIQPSSMSASTGGGTGAYLLE